MTDRAGEARRLATILTRHAGVHVLLRYERARSTYVVEWDSGPTVHDLYRIALQRSHEFVHLDVTALAWQEPVPQPRKHDVTMITAQTRARRGHLTKVTVL